MEIQLTELSLKDQALWFEGYTWGLDEGRIASEQLRAENMNEIQVLWNIIYGLQSDFTFKSVVGRNA